MVVAVEVEAFVPVFFSSGPQPIIMPNANSIANANNFFIIHLKSGVFVYSPEPFRRSILDPGD